MRKPAGRTISKSPTPVNPFIRPISADVALRLRAYTGMIKFIMPTAIPELRSQQGLPYLFGKKNV